MDSRRRMVESTRELLWERGYGGMSPKAIQERASVGQGSMYHHFATKSLLAQAALKDTAEAMCADAESLLCTNEPPLERVRNYLLKPREVLRGCRIGQMAHDPEIVTDIKLRQPIEAAFRRQRVLIGQALAQAQANGELAAQANPDDLAAAVCAVLQGAYTLARAHDSDRDFDQAIQGFLQLLAALTPDADQS